KQLTSGSISQTGLFSWLIHPFHSPWSLSAAVLAVIPENLVVDHLGAGSWSYRAAVLASRSRCRDTIKARFSLPNVPKEAPMTTTHAPRPQAAAEIPAVPLTTEGYS